MAFDRIVGPEGEWKDDGGARAEGSEFSEREEFIFRCLNAAVNLYGVVTAEEFANLYATYAKDKSPAVAAPVDEAEVRGLVDKVFAFQDRQENDPEADWGSDDALDFGESWFAWWKNPKTGECLFYYCSLLDDEDEDTEDSAEFDPLAEEKLADLIKARKVKEMKILAEGDFFLYEDCNGCEDSPEANQLAKFISREYHVSRDMAELDVMSIQAHARINGATTTEACEYVSEYCDWRPSNWAAFDRLVRALGPVLSVTRCWEFRGHTAHELSQLGLMPHLTEEKVYDVFGLDDDGDDDEEGNAYDDEEDACGFYCYGFAEGLRQRISRIDRLRVPRDFRLVVSLPNLANILSENSVDADVRFISHVRSRALDGITISDGDGYILAREFLMSDLQPAPGVPFQLEFAFPDVSGSDQASLRTPVYEVCQGSFEQYLFLTDFGSLENIPMDGDLKAVPS